MATYTWLNRALDGDAVWDMGQLSKDAVRVLDQAVRAGHLVKSRAGWAHTAAMKTVWYREDCPPQEVLAEQWRAQHAA